MGLFDKLKETLSEQMGQTSPTVNQKPEAPQNVSPSPAPASVQPTPVAPATSDNSGLYDAKLEQLIDMALADGELTEKEKQVLFKRAEAMGIDLDEFEMVLDARLYKQGQQQQPPAQQPATSAPKSDKYGDVKKCPACGAMIESFTARCPECGHEFTNIAANSSIQKLFEMLNQVEAESKDDAKGLLGGLGQAYGQMFARGGGKDVRKKISIIQNFPIPTTKDDILEFLSLGVPLAMKPKGLMKWDEEAIRMSHTWKSKCEQVIMKAKFSMREDKKTLELIAEYAKELKIKM